MTGTSSAVPLLDDPSATAHAAAAVLADLTGSARHDVALVMGSGWTPAADLVGEVRAEVSNADVPGFLAAGVVGHAGRIRSVELRDGRRALVFLGRTHLYEGHGVAAVAHAVRTAAAAGVSVVALTNAAGGLDPTWPPGTPVLISDHLNLTGRSPIVGADFVDLTDLYSARLRGIAREIDPTLAEGVYAQLPGPHFETPAEIRMLATIGATLVGMSTALEAIAARQAGVEVFGLSLVTNAAAGVTGEPLNHEEVLQAGRDAADRMGRLLAELLPRA